MPDKNLIWFKDLRWSDVDKVGGKNASLGEMISQLHSRGVRVPNGFATTADAFRKFLAQDGLDKRIGELLSKLDVDDVEALAQAGKTIRGWIEQTPFPQDLEQDLNAGWNELTESAGSADIEVAVRSSATAEDLPDASFAGQQETYLNIRGLDNVKAAMRKVFASLYNDRAISYRVHKGYDDDGVALSCGVQRMVRSDLGSSGVMFTLDTESGFDKVVFVTASFGLGECVVQGAVNPDEFYVHKANLREGRPAILSRKKGSKKQKMVFSDSRVAGETCKVVETSKEERESFALNDAELEELAKFALTIEEHYGRPMDVEWGKDGRDGRIYILQARPETVKSRQNKVESVSRYRLGEKSTILCSGRSIGQKIGQGAARLVKDASEMNKVRPGEVLVTDMTDPDWEPVMKKASAIVTNRGGRTCHAAIIARELGIPAVVGCGDATSVIKDGQNITVSCAEGETGNVYEGLLKIDVSEVELTGMPECPVKIMMNVGTPELAFGFSRLPNEGIGLARMEFIINKQIGIHPKLILSLDSQKPEVKEKVLSAAAGYASPTDFYVEKIVEGVSQIAASVFPKKIIVRLSDFKSNEYAKLLGGDVYEPHEENPMLGYRGAARYISDDFRPCFDLECRAIRKARDEMGFTNIEVMIPFVRTLKEAESVIKALKENGLERGKNGLRVIMMCEIPSNALLAEEFLAYFDGFSIGSNDMTQLTLGLDRDGGAQISASFDERDPAVRVLLARAIRACNEAGKYIGICGQGPSDHPDFAEWLVKMGIQTISLNPDTVVSTWRYLAKQCAGMAKAD